MTKAPLTTLSYSPRARAIAAAHQGENARVRAAVAAQAKRNTTPTVTASDVPARVVRDAYRGKLPGKGGR